MDIPSLYAPDRFFEPALRRERKGLSELARKTSAALSLASGFSLHKAMISAIERGDEQGMMKAFEMGAPWVDSTRPHDNPLSFICQSGENAGFMLSALQERGAWALGPAHRGDQGYAFGPEIAIRSGRWGAALFLASGCAKAFALSRHDPDSGELPLYFSPGEPAMPREFIKEHGAKPLTQALQAIVDRLEEDPFADGARRGAALFLKSALHSEALGPHQAEALDSFLSLRSRSGKGPVELAVAARAPDIIEALIRLSAPLKDSPDAVEALHRAQKTQALLLGQQDSSLQACELHLKAAGVVVPEALLERDKASQALRRFEERQDAARARAHLAPPAAEPPAAAPAMEPPRPAPLKRRVLAQFLRDRAGSANPSPSKPPSFKPAP